MSKKAFKGIMAGPQDALAIAEGRADPSTYRIHVPETVDVRAIRQGLGLTQAEFAAAFGFSVGSVRDWEQRRNQPAGTARVLLTVIERRPEAVREALELA
jgi:putative transcriptional regulator